MSFAIIVCGREVPVYIKTKRVMKEDWARFNDEDESIWVLDVLAPAMRRRTLAHEAFHAFLHFTGHNEYLATISVNAEEALTRAFEAGMGDHMFFNLEAETWIKGEAQG